VQAHILLIEVVQSLIGLTVNAQNTNVSQWIKCLAYLLVLVKIQWNDDQVWAKFFGYEARHGCSNPVTTSNVVGSRLQRM